MKKNTQIILLIIGILFIHNNIHCQIFDVKVDTINIAIKDSMHPATKVSLNQAIKYDNKYYCIFYEQNLYYSWKNNTYFFIISLDGIIEHRIELPPIVNYYDLFLKNEQIFLKDYYEHNTYYLDINKLKWIKTREIDNILYDDNDFYITYYDYGEWGYQTWFTDKKTKKEYKITFDGEIVNKINDTYYITGKNEIIKIDNPLTLKHSKKKSDNKILKSALHEFYLKAYSSEGAEVIYIDTAYSYFDFLINSSLPYIATSFVFDNQLFHLFNGTDITSIAKLEENKLIPVQMLDEKYNVFRNKYAYRMRIQKDNSQLLTFSTDDSNLFGFIEIQNNKINIRHVKLDVSPVRHLGKETFPVVFDFILSNIDYLPARSMDSLEKKIGGINMMHFTEGALHDSYYPNKNKLSFIGGDNYLKSENQYITNISRYYFTKKDSLIKTVFMEWRETEDSGNLFSYNFRSTEYLIPEFQEKVSEIEEYITDRTGIIAEKEVRPNNRIKQTWITTDGITINLFYNDNFKGKKEIRLVIYKE